MPDFNSTGDNAPQRKHVTRRQITALEAGKRVTLNSNQLDELLSTAPQWVRIDVHETSALLGQHVVSIADTRPQKPQPKLGVHYDPKTGFLTKSKRK